MLACKIGILHNSSVTVYHRQQEFCMIYDQSTLEIMMLKVKTSSYNCTFYVYYLHHNVYLDKLIILSCLFI